MADTDIAQAIIRILKNPNQQRLATELRDLILKGTNESECHN